MGSPLAEAAEPFEASRRDGDERQSHETDRARREEEEEEESYPDPIRRDHQPYSHHGPEDVEKAAPEGNSGPHHSLELTRTVSTRLSRVASRITTRDIAEPGPPPDGGVKAWTQVAMAFALTSSTWGYVNCMSILPVRRGEEPSGV